MPLSHVSVSTLKYSVVPDASSLYPPETMKLLALLLEEANLDLGVVSCPPNSQTP